MVQATADRIVYRWPRARLIRPLGFVLVVMGVVWVAVLTGLAITGHADAAPYAGLIVVSLLVALAAGILLARPPAVLELGPEGYRLHHLRGGGSQGGRWADVVTVATDEYSAGPVLVLAGQGDQRSLVPLALLGARADEAQAEVRSRLDAAYGYRPL